MQVLRRTLCPKYWHFALSLLECRSVLTAISNRSTSTFPRIIRSSGVPWLGENCDLPNTGDLVWPSPCMWNLILSVYPN